MAVHMDAIALAIADASDDREMRLMKNMSNRPADLHRINRIIEPHEAVEFT